MKKYKRKKANYWIQEAIQKPGALRTYVKKKYGKAGFDSKGRIKVSILKKLAQSDNPTIRRRAVLALTLRRFH